MSYKNLQHHIYIFKHIFKHYMTNMSLIIFNFMKVKAVF